MVIISGCIVYLYRFMISMKTDSRDQMSLLYKAEFEMHLPANGDVVNNDYNIPFSFFFVMKVPKKSMNLNSSLL